MTRIDLVSSAIDEEVIATADEPYSVRLAGKYGSAPASWPERRQFSRKPARELDWVRTVRLRTAGEVSLVDLSAGGALIDSRVPLRPGAALSLDIIGRGLETTVTLQILRCHVAELMADSARYRGACEFASPIELPGSHLVPERPAPDSFVGVDAALRQLVQRVDADISERLTPGDVMLVLQALARRAESLDDPFGRQVGSLLQELLPTLRRGHRLPTLLTAIERQLRQTLPHARLRLVDSQAETPMGTKSVLVRTPDLESSTESVSIDLPATLVVNDAQARLLRTSSRLIALVQRLDGRLMRSATKVASETDAVRRGQESAPGAVTNAWQKIVVRYADGHMLKGFTQDFHGSKSQFSVWPSPTAAAHERVVVPLARLKALFFVRDFDGNPDHIEQKIFENPAHGRRIEATLLDGEVLVGTTLNYRPDGTGFFIMPADPRANNLRVFVVSSAVRQVRFP